MEELLERINSILKNITGHDDICSGDEEQQDFDFGYLSSFLDEVSVNCDCSSPKAFGKSLADEVSNLCISDYDDPMGYIEIDTEFNDMLDVLDALSDALIHDTDGEVIEDDYEITVTYKLSTKIKAKSRLDAEEIAWQSIRNGSLKLGEYTGGIRVKAD